MPSSRNDELMKSIGRRIAEVRKAKGLTQERLAELVELEPTTVSRQETGHRAISLSTLARIAGVLGVGVGDLLDSVRPLPEPTLDADTEAILRLFNGLSSERKQIILKLVRELSQ